MATQCSSIAGTMILFEFAIRHNHLHLLTRMEYREYRLNSVTTRSAFYSIQMKSITVKSGVTKQISLLIFNPDSSVGVSGLLVAVLVVDGPHRAVRVLPPLELLRVDLLLPVFQE